MALPVGQDPGDPHARLEAFLEAAELATLPGRQVDLARLSLRAEEYLVVPGTAKCLHVGTGRKAVEVRQFSGLVE